jgi:hypothetical protein
MAGIQTGGLWGNTVLLITAALLRPFSADTNLPDTRRSQLNRLYARAVSTLDKLLQAVGLKAA